MRWILSTAALAGILSVGFWAAGTGLYGVVPGVGTAVAVIRYMEERAADRAETALRAAAVHGVAAGLGVAVGLVLINWLNAA